MAPARKRTIRLAVALTAAVGLASALLYVSFTGATSAHEPSDLLVANPDATVQLTGKVAEGSVSRDGERLLFEVTDRDGSESVSVVYTGTVPDPFREGRELIVTGRMEDGTFVAERDSMITKCPSKFEEDQELQSGEAEA